MSRLPERRISFIKGNAPDRSLTITRNDQEFTVLIAEVKTGESSKQRPDFLKLATMMKDVVDFAFTKGVREYHSTGVLVTGDSCSIYQLYMPLEKLYCLKEIGKFNFPGLPNNAPFSGVQLEKIVSSMLFCRQSVTDALGLMANLAESSSV